MYCKRKISKSIRFLKTFVQGYVIRKFKEASNETDKSYLILSLSDHVHFCVR